MADIVFERGFHKKAKPTNPHCAKAPRGAHHWVEEDPDDDPGMFTCKYCDKQHRFPVSFEDLTKGGWK